MAIEVNNIPNEIKYKAIRGLMSRGFYRETSSLKDLSSGEMERFNKLTKALFITRFFNSMPGKKESLFF